MLFEAFAIQVLRENSIHEARKSMGIRLDETCYRIHRGGPHRTRGDPFVMGGMPRSRESPRWPIQYRYLILGRLAMRIHEFLDHCAASERWVRDFYAFLAERLREDSRCAELFGQLAEEEEAHACGFEFLKPIAARSAPQIVVHDRFLADLDRMRKGMDQVRQRVESRNGSSLPEVLGLAILVEATTMERDKLAFARVEDLDFQKVLRGITSRDDAHRKKLEEMRDSLAPVS